MTIESWLPMRYPGKSGGDSAGGSVGVLVYTLVIVVTIHFGARTLHGSNRSSCA